MTSWREYYTLLENKCVFSGTSTELQRAASVQSDPVSIFRRISLPCLHRIFQYTTIGLNDLIRADIIDVTGDEYLVQSQFPGFLECQLESERAVTFPSLAGTDAVADVSTQLQQVFIEFMANINSSQILWPFHQPPHCVGNIARWQVESLAF